MHKYISFQGEKVKEKTCHYGKSLDKGRVSSWPVLLFYFLPSFLPTLPESSTLRAVLGVGPIRSYSKAACSLAAYLELCDGPIGIMVFSFFPFPSVKYRDWAKPCICVWGPYPVWKIWREQFKINKGKSPFPFSALPEPLLGLVECSDRFHHITIELT